MSAISNVFAPTYMSLARADAATRSGDQLAMRNEDGEPFPPTAIAPTPVQRTANLSEAPGGKSADNFVGVRTKASDGSTTLTQVRMQAVLESDGKTSKVVKIIAVGPVVSRDGKVMSERFKTYVVADTKGKPITDIAQAKERVGVMLKNAGVTTLTAEQQQKITGRTEQAGTDKPVQRTANLSEAPGGKSADNFVGVRTKASDGSTTLTQVRMQAVLESDGKTSKVVKIIAVGPVVSRDGKVMSERFKTYVAADTKGRPITDIAQARERVGVLLNNTGMTTLTAEQQQTMERAVQARTDKRDKLTESLRKIGPLKLKAPGIDYSSSVDRPNRFLGTTPAPQQVERSGTNVKWETDTPVPLTCSAMVVPNVVFEGGVTTNNGVAGSVTPQPLTGFFPCSNGLGDKHRQRTENSALARTTVHPAGFYPGDKEAVKWNKALNDNPKTTPEVRVSTWGQTSKIYTDDWSQTYVNIPNLAAPLVGISANFRAIKSRAEVRTAVYTQTDTIRGINSTQFAIAPYSWVQAHIKGSTVNIANPTRSAVLKAGVQSEVGVYVYNSTAGYAPKAGQIDGKRTNQDWHIVNGKINENRLDFLTQFAGISKHSSLYLLSESVMPDWGDRSAGVYVQVPSSPAGGTSSWQATKEKAIVSANRNRYVSVVDMAKMLNKVGTEMPQYKEFRFVTADTLQRLNGDRISMVKDPKTGKAAPMFEAEAWVNTSARVSIGGAGIFLPKDVAPGK